MNGAIAKIREVAGMAVLPAWLVLCLLLGGAASAGIFANAFLQAVSIAVILLFLWRLTTASGQRTWSDIKSRQGQGVTTILILTAVILGWIVVQIVPLPAGLWQSLGGRSIIEQGDKLLGVGNVARPLSMQPNATLVSAAWILVPLATFLLTLRANLRVRRYAGYAIVAVAILSSAIGVVQLGQGVSSPAYFYDITNDNTSVGFFANSNHLATLYLCALVMCPWLFFTPGERSSRQDAALSLLGVIVAGMLVLNIAVNRSLAGYILLLPAAAYVLLQHPAGRDAIDRLPFSRRTLLAVLAIVTLLVGWLMFAKLSDFSVGLTDPDTRLAYYAKSFQIIGDTIPFGTGLGAFRWVYTGYENPELVDLVYVNHVHNDYIELLVEGGLVTLMLLVAFAWWLLRRFPVIRDLPAWQLPLQLASVMTIAMIAAHSLVDYPGRTAAIAAIGAFAIANLASPPQRRSSGN